MIKKIGFLNDGRITMCIVNGMEIHNIYKYQVLAGRPGEITRLKLKPKHASENGHGYSSLP